MSFSPKSDLPLLLALLGLPLAGCAAPSGGGDDDDASNDDDAVDDDDTEPDDGLAENGWPDSHLPDDYVGTGLEVGDYIPLWEAPLSDQLGNDDVVVEQFYGSMLLLNFGAVWCPPCNAAAANSQSLADAFNGASSQYEFWSLEILVDDADSTPGSGGADLQDAEDWSDDYGIHEPVLHGDNAEALGETWQISSLPTFFIVDPYFQIREKFLGYPGNAGLGQAISGAWNQFIFDNPDWESPFTHEED